jgi:predicted porin
MNKGVTRFSLAALTALCMGVVAPAHAVDVKAGNWDLSFSGNVNAFATYTVCGVGGAGGPNSDVILGQACTRAKDSPTGTFAVESGLLPSAFVFTAKTRAYDLDVSATVSFWPGLHVSDTRTGLASSEFSADIRQNFLTFGDASWGTIKLGKDLGLFGADAILSDMTLLGIGGGTAGAADIAVKNHNVTIGHIGTGYLYADWIPQVTYISPNFGGAQLSIAVIEAFKTTVAAGSDAVAAVRDDAGNVITPAVPAVAAQVTQAYLPGVQAKLTYDLTGPVSGRVWAGGVYYNTELNNPARDNPKLDSVAGELGVKLNVSGLQPMIYGYYGKGIGTFAFDVGAATVDANGDPQGRTSYGWLAQVQYQIPGTKFRPGISWGMSYLNQEAGDPDALMHWNGMGTVALFYQATDTLTLVAEFDHVRARNWAGGEAKHNSGGLGAIIFF